MALHALSPALAGEREGPVRLANGRVRGSAPTLAAASRERRCIATGEVLPEEKLVRFAAGPGGVVFPDVARKLPGRGLWVTATRAAVEQAAKKGGFSRAAKTALKPPADLADQVESLLKTRLLQALGLARRGGEITWGFEKVSSAIGAGKAAWLIEASDGAADGRRKLLGALRRATAQGLPEPRLIGCFSSVELGLALGLDNVIHTAFLAGRGAERWTVDVERLSGFCPLLPTSWGEEP